jgi:hypothetical protein
MIDVMHIGGTTDWFQCLCGNEPHSDGFFSCDSDGAIVSPSVTSGWNERTYVCGLCHRIIDGQTLQVLGVCSEQVVFDNDRFDWSNY